MAKWYVNPQKCKGCENYAGDACLYDLELEEKEDKVAPGTYTDTKMCPYYSLYEEN